MDVTVIGCGVSGLSCGVRLLEEGGAGCAVTIAFSASGAGTTSAVAGAVWFPYRVLPNSRTGPWAAASYERFAGLAASGDGAPVTEVELTMLYPEVLRSEPWWVDAVPGGRVRAVGAGELPSGYADGRALMGPCVEAPAYLEWLLARFESLGGRLDCRRVERLSDAPGDVVVNCAGWEAGDLAGDPSVVPVRGQVAYVRPRAGLRFLIDEESENALAYVLPRRDVVVLGGTAEEGDLERSPRAATTESILARCTALEPSLAGAEVIGSAVGFRPGRPAVRLESEVLPDGRKVVHNYGHGGSGFTLSWGCADEVAGLVLG